ncbi:methyltransferase TYW3-domain-containing protein [Aspergillus unguis]
MIPPAFTTRKAKILAGLSTPEEDYSDLSPKGSVDEGIRDLIQDINSLPGLVTTSSCAGRISVFLEGRRAPNAAQVPEQQPTTGELGEQKKFAPSGGKGAGRWLYVSHEPLDLGAYEKNGGKKSLLELFEMVPGDGKPPGVDKESHAPRLVRFHFDPMILHIMTATLHHAQPVLSAASSSGFRESGLQSLRCLEGDKAPSPIVAVRSAGLSFESVIGYCEDDNQNGDGKPVIRSLVSEEYLQMLVTMSNERFSVNTERKERFKQAVLSACSVEDKQSDSGSKSRKQIRPGWEDPETRRERKRAEGLMRKNMLESQAQRNDNQDVILDSEAEILALDT